MRRFMTTLLDIIERLATETPVPDDSADEEQENAGEAIATSAIEGNALIGSNDTARPTRQTDDKTHVGDIAH